MPSQFSRPRYPRGYYNPQGTRIINDLRHNFDILNATWRSNSMGHRVLIVALMERCTASCKKVLGTDGPYNALILARGFFAPLPTECARTA